MRSTQSIVNNGKYCAVQVTLISRNMEICALNAQINLDANGISRLTVGGKLVSVEDVTLMNGLHKWSFHLTGNLWKIITPFINGKSIVIFLQSCAKNTARDRGRMPFFHIVQNYNIIETLLRNKCIFYQT